MLDDFAKEAQCIRGGSMLNDGLNFFGKQSIFLLKRMSIIVKTPFWLVCLLVYEALNPCLVSIAHEVIFH